MCFYNVLFISILIDEPRRNERLGFILFVFENHGVVICWKNVFLTCCYLDYFYIIKKCDVLCLEIHAFFYGKKRRHTFNMPSCICLIYICLFVFSSEEREVYITFRMLLQIFQKRGCIGRCGIEVLIQCVIIQQ